MKILIENCRRNFKKPYVIDTVAELVSGGSSLRTFVPNNSTAF